MDKDVGRAGRNCMDRNTRRRIAPLLIMVLCLLVLSLVAPPLWRSRLQPQPRVTRPLKNFTLIDVIHQRPLPGWDGEASLTTSLTARANNQAIAPQLLASDSTALLDDTAAEDGAPRSVAFGPLVANQYEASAAVNSTAANGAGGREVFPPAVPRLASRLDQRLQLQRDTSDVFQRLAMRLSYTAASSKVSTVWPRPYALIEQLENIEGYPRGERWASAVLVELQSLAEVDAIACDESAAVLARLGQLAEQVDSFVRNIRRAEVQADVLSARDALDRRVGLWRQIHTITCGQPSTQFVSNIADDELAVRIDAAIASIPGNRAPQAWKEFLRLDELKAEVSPGPADVHRRAHLASAVLDRMHSQRMEAAQQEVVSTPAFNRLREKLRHVATQPVEALEVIYAVEQYENSRTATDARRLAERTAQLRWSTDRNVARLARHIDENYREANVRIAVTDDFLNRTLPKVEPKTEPVDDIIAGNYVNGQRQVETQLSLRLIPDAARWRVSMEAQGTMHSNTASYASRATVATQGTGTFTATKLVLADRHRIHLYGAKSQASYAGQLCGVSTTMDGIPIVNRFARNTAVEGYYQNRWQAQQEIEAKLNTRAKKLLDEQAREAMDDANEQMERRILDPLDRTGVEAIVTGLRTTEDRVVGHYRLAGERQLGGHTPRPWAPDNALLSMQIHESAFNNIVAGLQLDGRQGTVKEIMAELYDTFGREPYVAPDSLPEEMTLLFADENAVQIKLAETHLEVTLRIAELRTEDRIWRGLTVRNTYAPDPSSLTAPLVRDSTVRLKGERLGIRDQVALRGIFTKLFGDNREFAMLPARLAEDPRMEGLAITQYVIRDGWLGLAIAPPHRGMETETSGDEPAEREARLKQVIFE